MGRVGLKKYRKYGAHLLVGTGEHKHVFGFHWSRIEVFAHKQNPCVDIGCWGLFLL